MREKLFASGVTIILVYLAWAWGGLQQGGLVPVVWASIILLMALLVSPVKIGIEMASRSAPWWRDAFFYGGLLFLIYLAIQWGNAGRVLFFDVGLSEWRYSPPHHAGWPSAFSRQEAAEMLAWFFPAWVLALMVRSPFIGKEAVLSMLRALVYGAGLLALVGIIQFITQAKARYWIRPTAEFFASFGYTNHAAAFFVLMGALAAGLLFREIFSRSARTRFLPIQQQTEPLTILFLAASLVLCLVGANLSLSRAGIILAWALAGFVAVYGLIRGWEKLHSAGRLNLAAATVAVLFVFYFAVAGFGSKSISKEFTVKKPVHHVLFSVLDNLNLSFGGRAELDEAAWRMWQDHKLFGVGGWGYRYLLAFYMPKEDWTAYVKSAGKANVHCDLLQFLAEFGIVGFGLMLAAVGALIFLPLPFMSAVAVAKEEGERAGVRVLSSRRDPLWIMGVIGLSLVVIFSFIDLPFRCPAILCTWIVILATLPKVTAKEDGNTRIINNR